MNAADLMGWSDHVGSLEAGKWADLIAVPGDPLKDPVERVFAALTFALFVAALSIYVAIVREALPQLSVEERHALRTWPSTPLHQLRVTDRAIGNAWKVHASMYPKSHKRFLFAVLLITAALSLFGFPVWSVLR